MIKTISLTNFKSHKETTIELHPNVNLIVGTSDSGKSTILKAVRWLATNKPGGDSVRRWGTKATEISITTDDGHIFKRGKSNKNYYSLDDKLLEAFGTEVPDCVSKALKIGDFNFQQQKDSHYLFSQTSGEVAKKLNAAADLEIIDKSYETVSSNIRKFTTDKSYLEERKTELSVKKDKFAELTKLNEEYIILAGCQEQLDKTAKNIDSMLSIAGRIRTLRSDVAKCGPVSELFGECVELLERQTQQETLKNNLKQMENKRTTLTNLKSNFKKYHGLKELAQELDVLIKRCLDVEKIDEMFEKMINWKRVYTNLKDEFKKYDGFKTLLSDVIMLADKDTRIKTMYDKVRDMINCCSAFKKLQEHYKKTTQEKEELDKIVSENLKTCPLCGRS